MSKQPLRVCLTGSAGQIAYSFIGMLGNGLVFGHDQPIILNLLDIPQMEGVLKGVKMEIDDCAFPIIQEVNIGSDCNEMFKDIDIGIFLGGFPRKPGMERKDLIGINVKIFKEQGAALDKHAKKTVKCLVVANPANTNCLTLSKNAPSIPKENFTCLTRLDHNRALSQLALRAKVPIKEVKNVIIWGNHSTTQYPDVNHGTISGKKIREVINDEKYLNEEFVTKIQKRGGEILEARKNSSVVSAANAVKDHLVTWLFGTLEGEWVSMGIITDGTKYGIEGDFCYSMPCTCKNFTHKVVENLPIDEFSKKLQLKSLEELKVEKKDAEI